MLRFSRHRLIFRWIFGTFKRWLSLQFVRVALTPDAQHPLHVTIAVLPLELENVVR